MPARGFRKIRHNNTSMQIIVDGVPQLGSFQDVENFRLSPVSEVSRTRQLGDPSLQPDFKQEGWEFSFTLYESDDVHFDNLVYPLVRAYQAGGVMPNVVLVFTKRFRDAARSVSVTTLKNVGIKLDSEDDSGDFLKATFSGFCADAEKGTGGVL